MSKEKADHVVEVIMVKIQNRQNNDLKKSFVVPGHQKAHRNEVINWEMVDTGAVFYFPDDKLFGKKEYRVKKGDSLTLSVSEDAERGEYPYAVITDNNDFAEGGSFPRMIIR